MWRGPEPGRAACRALYTAQAKQFPLSLCRHLDRTEQSLCYHHAHQSRAGRGCCCRLSPANGSQFLHHRALQSEFIQTLPQISKEKTEYSSDLQTPSMSMVQCGYTQMIKELMKKTPVSFSPGQWQEGHRERVEARPATCTGQPSPETF